MKTNFFSDFPPAVAMLVVALSLVTMAQFSSTERLAAAMAWLIFVAVLLANGQTAFKNIGTMIGATDTTPNPLTGKSGPGSGVAGN